MRAIGRPDWMVCDRGAAGRAHVGERAGPGRDRLGNAREAQRDLDDDAERALRADEDMGEVVAGRGFLRPRAGAHERAVGRDDAERQHELLHRAVAHRVGARGAGRRHAADRSVGAGIDREEEAGVVQVVVELLAGDAGLDHAVEVLGVDGEHRVHPRAVERDPAVRRIDMALERGADAERDDRRVVPGAELARGRSRRPWFRRTRPRPAAGSRARSAYGRAPCGSPSEAVKRLPNRAARSALSAATASGPGGLRACGREERRGSWRCAFWRRCRKARRLGAPRGRG